MWTEIDAHISQVTGNKFESSQRRGVGGGCINQGHAVSDSTSTYFVKINQASRIDMFEAEKLGLEQISATNTIRVPQPLCYGLTGNYSYLVLEWLEMSSGNNSTWEQMGRQLAAMHRYPRPGKGFGWQMNNTIGSTPQINTWTADWEEFFTKHRLGYQFQLARRRGDRFGQEQELLAAIPELLVHHPQPSLVHGDLWGGNAGCTLSEPVIFDPATYYGDREVDIAMTELFGGFPTAFYRGYEEVFPLDSGYKQRKALYNLYHVLNHFNLFGGGYESQANGMIRQILG